jgi:serine/threonine-protein kinase RsbT
VVPARVTDAPPESEVPVPPEPAESAAAGSSETTVAIRSEVDIVSARHHGRALAMRLGFTQTDATLVATAISELARNIILYAGQGTILLKALDAGRGPGVLVIARDDGPGIADLRGALAGGYSTSGGLGLGLCGVRRLVDEFDLVSGAGQGTTVTFKKWKARSQGDG